MKWWTIVVLCLTGLPVLGYQRRIIREPVQPAVQTPAKPQQPQIDPATMVKMQELMLQQQAIYWSNHQAAIARIIAAERARPKEDPAKVDKRVVEFLKDRVEHGSIEARCDLGKRYLTGRGVDQDETKARQLLQEAAAQGNKESARILAELGTPPTAEAPAPKPSAAERPAEVKVEAPGGQ